MKIYTGPVKKLSFAISIAILLNFTASLQAQSVLWGVNPSGGDGFGTLYGLPTGSTGIATQTNMVGYPGSNPQYTKLIQHNSNGKLYGLTSLGGANGVGVIFEYDTATGGYSRKIDLVSSTGANPKGALMQASNNKFYGMTQLGGANGFGVIFEYDASVNTYTTKVDFTGTAGVAAGREPWGTLTESFPNSGKLYGMTRLGGANGFGVLFEYDYNTNTYTKKFDFTGTAGSYPGSNPFGQLTKVGTKLYGLTSLGGANNIGTLFEFDYLTDAYVLRKDMVLATGSTPQGSLVQAGTKLYGMTAFGGTGSPSAGGVIFEFDYGTNIYAKLTDLVGGTGNGANPTGELLLASNGKLYGMTRFGGSSNAGAIFEYDLTGPSYTKRVDMTTANGSQPLGSLIQVNTGKIYGLTSIGGLTGGGVLFQYSMGATSIVKKVDLNSSNGGFPNGPLVLANNGKLYGMAVVGGTTNLGVIYEYDRTTGVYTKKIDLSSTTGNTPFGGLLQATNGNLFGLTTAGGTSAQGTLIEYNYSTNAVTKRVDFTGNAGINPGGVPYGSLVQASSNNKLYGMTKNGGSGGLGVIFEYDITTNTYVKKVDFTAANGYSVTGSFVEASNGKLYGLTQISSGTGFGAIIEYDPGTTTYTKVVEFTGTTGSFMGSNPAGSMIQTSAGILYGMTKTGGAFSQGVIFEYNVTTNTYTKKFDLQSSTGSQPLGSLVKAANGMLYGVTNLGGANSVGALFEYDIATTAYTKKIDFNGTTGSFPGYTKLLEVCTSPLTPGSITASSNTLCETSSGNLTYGISAVSNATSYVWTLPSGSSIVSGGTTTNLTANLAGVAPATYTYGVAGVNICGTGTLSVSSLTVHPKPSISVNSGPICSGNSFTIIGNGAATYTPQGGSFIVSPLSNTTYTIAGTSAFGCVSSNTPVSSVTVNALPTVSVNSGTICAGNNFVINASGAFTYTYAGGSSNTFAPTSNSTYPVTGTDVNGCVSSNTAISSVTVNALPVISVNNGTICAGKTHTFIPGGANIYTITGGSTGTSFLVSPTSSTSYTFAGTSTAGCVSAAPATGNVLVNQLPIINVNSGTICAGGTHTFIPGGASIYTITGGATGTSFNVSPGSSASYTFMGTDALGCVSAVPATGNVLVNVLPTINVNSGTICAGGTYVFVPGGANTYTITGGASGTSFPVSPLTTTSYAFVGTSTAGCVSSVSATGNVTVFALPTVSVNSGTICLGKSFTINPTGAGSGATYAINPGNVNVVTPSVNTLYSITGTNSIGCASSNTGVAGVTVIALPIISATNGAICLGNIFTTTVSGATSYTYASTTSNINASGSVTLNPTATTSYSVSGTSAVGCVSGGPFVMTVTVNSLPPVAITGNTAICDGQTTTLTASGAANYNWGTSTNSFIVVSPSLSTTYSVQGTDLNSCSNLAAFNLVVNPLPIITVISGAICPGNTYTLTPSGAASYTFSSGGNVVFPATTSTYSVTGTSTAGCVSLLAGVATVSVVNILTVTISGNLTICNGGTVNLTANGASTYTWSTGPATNTLAATPTANTTYTVVGASGSCSDTTDVAVVVNALPSVSISASVPIMCLGENATLVAGGAVTYTWSTGLNTPVIIVSPQVTTSYTLMGTNGENCSNSAVFVLVIDECLGVIQHAGSNMQYQIYPNPNSGEFTIETSAQVAVTVINALGEIVLRQQANEGKNNISLNENAKGIYFVQLKQGNLIKTIKVVKQ